MIESFRLERMQIADIPNWDEMVRSSKQGTVFNTLAWADILKEIFGLKDMVLCIIKNNNIIGALPVFFKIRYGIKVITPIPLTQYMGTLFFFNNDLKNQKHEQYMLEIHDLIIRELRKEFKFCNFTLHTSIIDIRPFQWDRWEVKPQYSYQISTKDPDSIWLNFSSSLRRKITNASVDNLVFKEESDIEDLVKIHEESYTRKGLNIIMDRKLLSKYISIVREKDLVKIYSIYDVNGKVCSSRAVLLWNNVIYDWIAGTSTGLKETNAAHLLIWKILQKFSKEGYILFDFMGANTKKIIDFKKSFGGNLIPYYEVKLFSSRWLKMLYNINEFKHRLTR